MSVFFSIFVPLFIALLILVMIFDLKPSKPKADSHSESEPINVEFDVISPTPSTEMLRIIEVVKDGDKLQLKRECEDDSIPASVLVITLDGTVIGRVEKPYSLSFYTEVNRVIDCEAISVLLGAQLYIRARAVFKPGSYIYNIDA